MRNYKKYYVKCAQIKMQHWIQERRYIAHTCMHLRTNVRNGEICAQLPGRYGAKCALRT